VVLGVGGMIIGDAMIPFSSSPYSRLTSRPNNLKENVDEIRAVYLGVPEIRTSQKLEKERK